MYVNRLRIKCLICSRCIHLYCDIGYGAQNNQTVPSCFVLPGTEFVNKLNAELFKLTGINHHITTAYHPKANGLMEKQNASNSQSLRACIKDQEDWYHPLDSITFSFRVSQHHSTGKTSFEMMFGHLSLLPIQLKTRPYYMQHTDGDADFINGPNQLKLRSWSASSQW